MLLIFLSLERNRRQSRVACQDSTGALQDLQLTGQRLSLFPDVLWFPEQCGQLVLLVERAEQFKLELVLHGPDKVKSDGLGHRIPNVADCDRKVSVKTLANCCDKGPTVPLIPLCVSAPMQHALGPLVQCPGPRLHCLHCRFGYAWLRLFLFRRGRWTLMAPHRRHGPMLDQVTWVVSEKITYVASNLLLNDGACGICLPQDDVLCYAKNRLCHRGEATEHSTGEALG
mmetsp:Transcript_131160/g.339674  ORF Transcript_131160/g.339674 Transcript_131160/m.339674 type:complete len:228 (-) Transcript_131160:1416-2099(-)